MGLRSVLLAACLAAMPVAAFADDIPEPPSKDMGESPTLQGGVEPERGHAGDNSDAMGSAAATAADPNDERDQNAVGSEFDGSHPAGGDDTPGEPGGTHVEPNGDP